MSPNLRKSASAPMGGRGYASAMAVEIIYETPAISTDKETGIAKGWLPGRLSEQSRVLTRELGEHYHGQAIDAVFDSGLVRAVETAHIAFRDTNISSHQDARLRECNYGLLNGMPVARIAAEHRRRIDEPFPEGQSHGQVVVQTRDFLRDLATDRDGSRVVIVAHLANRWALQHLLEGIALEVLVDAPFAWQPGWPFTLPREWNVTDAGLRTESMRQLPTSES